MKDPDERLGGDDAMQKYLLCGDDGIGLPETPVVRMAEMDEHRGDVPGGNSAMPGT